MLAGLLDLLLSCQHLGFSDQRASVVRCRDSTQTFVQVLQVVLAHDHAGNLREAVSAYGWLLRNMLRAFELRPHVTDDCEDDTATATSRQERGEHIDPLLDVIWRHGASALRYHTLRS